MDKDTFINEIIRLQLEARDKGENFLEVSAGKVHRNIGGYPGPEQQILECCKAMYMLKSEKDEVIHSPSRGWGATLKIKYHL